MALRDSRFGTMRIGNNVGRSVVFSVAMLALSMFFVAPALAQGSGSWTLDCKGNALGGASWSWLLNGAPISGASGSAGCSGTMSVTGPALRPANANGLFVSVGGNGNVKTVTMSFDATQSVQVHLNAGASDRICVPDPESRNCVWHHFHEDAHFSLLG